METFSFPRKSLRKNQESKIDLTGFLNAVLTSLVLILILVTLFHPVEGRREWREVTGRRLQLSEAIGSEVSCHQSSASQRYKLRNISVSSLTDKEVAASLHYDVAMSIHYHSAILGVSSSMDKNYRQEAETAGLCVTSTNLKQSNLTFHLGEDDIFTVYFLNALNITLGKENKSISLHSEKGVQMEAVLSRTVLNTGNGTLILQRMCFLDEVNGMSVSILSTQPSFPMDDSAFMDLLKKELETGHNVTFTGIKDCLSDDDFGRRSPWVVAIAITCFVSGVILMILYICLKIFKVIKLPCC